MKQKNINLQIKNIIENIKWRPLNTAEDVTFSYKNRCELDKGTKLGLECASQVLMFYIICSATQHSS